jgi:hypothetical protein
MEGRSRRPAWHWRNWFENHVFTGAKQRLMGYRRYVWSGQSQREERVGKVTRVTQTGTLTGTDRIFYKNAYPVTAVVYSLSEIQTLQNWRKI